MTQEEIIEYNKRCATFLWPDAKKEYESGEIEIEDGIFKKAMLIFGHFHLMKFHSDWNWIMEIVEAIEKLGYESLIGGSEYYYPEKGMRYIKSFIKDEINIYHEAKTKKEAVVEAINQFLMVRTK